MKTGIERIHELLEELAEATKAIYPDYTRISTSCSQDGYRSFTILKWDDGEDAETTKRKVLFDQTKLGESDWGDDQSAVQNAYYESEGLLMQ